MILVYIFFVQNTTNGYDEKIDDFRKKGNFRIPKT